jgi:hypothetical protein
MTESFALLTGNVISSVLFFAIRFANDRGVLRPFFEPDKAKQICKTVGCAHIWAKTDAELSQIGSVCRSREVIVFNEMTYRDGNLRTAMETYEELAQNAATLAPLIVKALSRKYKDVPKEEIGISASEALASYCEAARNGTLQEKNNPTGYM